tara:strand:- start:658 stop:2931 length:2274 start_codon:yes stop_codon:yes gene_type:complete
MKKLKIDLKVLKYLICSCLFFCLFTKSSLSNEITFEIQGNEFTDSYVILSLLNEIPENIDKESSNDIIKALNESNLFSDVLVKFEDNKYIIVVKEYPNIDKIYFKKNDRLDDDELSILASEIQLKTFNDKSINLYIDEVKKIYETYGYNDVEITFYEKVYKDTNTIDLYFEFNEGKITKIDNIIINGNNLVSAQEIREIINSKTKTIRNLFANNNFKPNQLERDKFTIINFYKNNGFIDVKVETNIEYFQSNKVNIYFNITEGDLYSISTIKFEDTKNILNKKILDKIEARINNFLSQENIFSLEGIQLLKNDITSIIFENDFEFFEIATFDKVEDTSVDILFQISQIEPKYANQINIIGNSRTQDYVIRRELDIVEGDAFYDTQLESIRDKLVSLNLFENVNVKQKNIDTNNVNIIIEVDEKQTGTFNAGVSVGTIDGFSVVTGLRERNFYGTGRSLDVLLNTSKDKNQFKLITKDRLSQENDADINYNLNYKQLDFSKASSYKLDTISSGVGIGYKLNKNLYHNVDLEYVLKDYKITDKTTVSNSILDSSGTNISYLFKNNLRYSTLNSGFIFKSGQFVNFNNTIETPTSSSNGFVRNLITFKQYHSQNENNIFSIQTKVGNIISLNNNDILTDDKFSLGGRWLRGFDSYGAGPRNSRTSYVGGNNIIATKLDYSYEVSNNSNFPIFLNIFNDYGLIWENKTTPANNDNSLRSSFGFGIKYYSPIGPIGFTWGFPLMEEKYDIKRMFLFSIGNID